MIKTSDTSLWHYGALSHGLRDAPTENRSAVLWFTGLHGSGKKTIARALEARLLELGGHSYLLQCANVRDGLCFDLGFSERDRHENVRRIGELAKLFLESGTMVLAAFISPYREDRERLRQGFGAERFIEIHCDCPLEVCESRDTTGVYRQARAGEIPEYTGVSAPYEAPENPDLVLDTARLDVEECVERIVIHLEGHGFLMPKRLAS